MSGCASKDKSLHSTVLNYTSKKLRTLPDLIPVKYVSPVFSMITEEVCVFEARSPRGA